MTAMASSPLRRRLGVRVNPVIVREMRAQMRGARAFLILTGYLLVLSVLTYGIYRFTTLVMASSYASAVQSATIGKLLFVSLSFLDLLLICFITPALTAGALSGEHERGTYDLLMATPLTPGAIFWGKFIPAMTYAFLLILASIPTFSIAYLFGGVTVRDMVQVVLILSATATMLGALSLWLSSVFRRTSRATVVAYILVALLLFGTLFVWFLLGLRQSQQADMMDSSMVLYIIPPYPLYLNPLSALGSAILGFGLGDYYYGFPFSLLTSNGPFNLQYAAGMQRPLWQYTVSLYAMLVLFFYFLALQQLKPIRRWHFTRREVAQSLMPLLAIASLGYVTFGTTWASTGLPGSGTVLPTPGPPAVPIEVVRPAIPGEPVKPALDPDLAVPALQEFVARKLFPEPAFCSFFLLQGTYTSTKAELEGAIYCQAFTLQADGSLEPGAAEQHTVRAVLLAQNDTWMVAESNLDVVDLGTIEVDWASLEQDVLKQAQNYQPAPAAYP